MHPGHHRTRLPGGPAIEGLGPLSYEARRGLYLHPTYVVTPQREPLGVTNAWTWAREAKQPDGTRGGLLESVRWVEGYERMHVFGRLHRLSRLDPCGSGSLLDRFLHLDLL